MTGIQSIYTPFSSISKLDGMPALGLMWESIQVQHIPYPGKSRVQSYDQSLRIETQEAHDQLIKMLKSSLENHQFSFTSLTLTHRVQKIDIDSLFHFFPLIKHLIIGSNQSILVSRLLNQLDLTILHINESKIYWNTHEKHNLLSHGYRKNLNIFIQSTPYKFDYPSRLFFKFGFTILNILLFCGLTHLMSMNFDDRRQGTNFFTHKSTLSLLIIAISLLAQIKLYSFSQKKQRDRSFEMIRQQL